MINNMKTLLFVVLMMSGVANAQLLTDQNFTKRWNINGVPVASDVVYAGTKLYLTGTGTAVKKISMSKVKLFVMQYFTQYPNNFSRNPDGALNSIKNVGLTAFRLTFMRGLDSATIHDSIAGLINANITDSEKPLYQKDVEAVLSAINSDESFTNGSSIAIGGYNNFVTYENTKNSILTISSNNSDFVTRLYSMFLGKTTDFEGQRLKAELLQDPTFTFGDKQ